MPYYRYRIKICPNNFSYCSDSMIISWDYQHKMEGIARLISLSVYLRGASFKPRCYYMSVDTVSLQLTPFNQLVYLLGSNVIFSILLVTIDPQLDSCIMYSVYCIRFRKSKIIYNKLQTLMINSIIKVCKNAVFSVPK